MTPRNKQESALGKGLDALIRSDYLDDEEKSADEEKNEKIEVKKDSSAKKDSSTTTKTVDEPETSEKVSRTEIEENQILNVDEKIVDKVLLEVHKNPRISLWSAKSAAVLRFLKKTKPEFSISNEASLLIEAAVKDQHPEIWKIFEEKGL